MSVNTVCGPITADDLGVVLAHEHLFIDLRNQFTEFAEDEQMRISQLPVAPDVYSILSKNPYAVRDNLVLDDPVVMAAEVRAFAEHGGRTIVDCTSIGIRRDANALRTLSAQTGIQIVAGCGYYTWDTHPVDLSLRTVDDIAGEMLCELTEGIDGTGIRAGVIGELGTSEPIHPDEWKVLDAAARVHAVYPAPIYVHIYPWGTRGAEIAEFLLANGVAPAKVVICHVDTLPDLDYIRAVLRLGVNVECDNFGKEFPVEEGAGFAGGRFADDRERVLLLCRLVEEGYLSQLLISNDICLKTMLHRYGGQGYHHLLTHIVPQLAAQGISPAQIAQLLRGNPARVLDVADIREKREDIV